MTNVPVCYLSSLFPGQDVTDIFGNLPDIYSISVSFLSQLEDAMEMMDDNSSYPAIGECFEEIAEVGRGMLAEQISSEKQ